MRPLRLSIIVSTFSLGLLALLFVPFVLLGVASLVLSVLSPCLFYICILLCPLQYFDEIFEVPFLEREEEVILKQPNF